MSYFCLRADGCHLEFFYKCTFLERYKIAKRKSSHIPTSQYSLFYSKYLYSSISWFVFSKEIASVKGSFVLLKEAPSIWPPSLFSCVVNESGALLARFGKKFGVILELLWWYFLGQIWSQSSKDSLSNASFCEMHGKNDFGGLHA